ncbi:hypothetical protein OTB17_03830 [Massilia sp. H27-R4]|nr:hypothetical protein [Massilia sp. H27-R4]
MSTLQIRRLKAFGTQIYDDAARNLNLLRTIENTLDALDSRYERLCQENEAADRYIKLLREHDLPESSGETDLISLFENTRDLVGATYEKFSQKHLCAVNAPELCDDDGVVEAYAVLLTELASLHDKLNTLCWIIGEQDADKDETLPGEFSSADDLFAAMGV